jgi:hypothetical protein
MASEVHNFVVTVSAGTTQGAPQFTPLTIPQRVVQQINIKIPPGPRGLMGFQIGSTGTQLIPAIPGAWIITDNEKIEYPLENYIDSGSWQAIAYNTGRYNHSFYVTFLCAVPGIVAPSGPSLIDLSTLTSS